MKTPSNPVIALFLACLVAVILTVTAPQIGLTWDEPAYIAPSEPYAAWFGVLFRSPGEAFKQETIDAYWSITHEHPPLDRTWSGLVWSLARNVLDDLTAHRLGNMLLVALMVGLLYFMIAENFGKAAGLFAALALIGMPRFFFHAHLAALDVPVAVAIFLVTLLFWKTIDRKEWWWGIVLGLAWGLALSVKLNAAFLPIGLVVWFLFFRREWYVVLRLALMGIFALPAFILVWPWLYYQTWERLVAYANFHLDHFPIGQWYFGRFHVPPPWHFVFVMLFAVVPLAILLLAFVGMSRAGKGGQDKGLVWLLIISAAVSILPFAFGISLVYDNERLYMPVFPFLAALAGVGFGGIAAGIGKRFGNGSRPALGLTGLLVLIACVPQLVASARLYPHLLSYYSEGVGGLPGATRMGLETTYWCESFASTLEYINEHANPRDRIWSDPWSHDVLLYYQMHGRLRDDVFVLVPANYVQSIFGEQAPPTRVGDYRSAEWAIFQYRQTMYGDAGLQNETLLFFQQKEPVLRVEVDGIPIVDLYKR